MSEPRWVVGFHAVMDALEESREVEVVWVQAGRKDKRIRRIVSAARDRRLRVKTVERKRLDEISGGVPHNGCGVRCAPVALASVDEIVSADHGTSGVVLLDGVQDPHNLGSVIRSAAAFGVRFVVIAGHAVPPLGGAASKAAAGQLGRVQLVRSNVAADVLSTLQDHGYWVFGGDMSGTPLSQVTIPDKWVLCLGEERRGLRAKTRSRVDELVAIPMSEGVESLNLGVSAGIFLYEFCRKE